MNDFNLYIEEIKQEQKKKSEEIKRKVKNNGKH